jgi:predicted GIY-YIG superfamily endonuclease
MKQQQVNQKRRSGVYILCQRNKAVYVGQTDHFRERIRHHAWAKRFNIGRIWFKPIEDRSERLATERELIQSLQPAYNCQRQQPRDSQGRFMKEQS